MPSDLLTLARESAAGCSCSKVSMKRDVHCPLHGVRAGHKALLDDVKKPCVCPESPDVHGNPLVMVNPDCEWHKP